MKTQYMNMFFNDSYPDTEETAWRERGTGERSKPVMKNNNFVPKETLVFEQGKAYNLALFLNTSDKNVKYISMKIEESTYGAKKNEFKPTSKERNQMNDIKNVFDNEIIKDEDIPF